MKNKKLIAIAVIIAAALSLMACSMISNVKSIDFTKAPNATYNLNDDVNASLFEIAVEIEGAGTQTFNLNDPMLTVEGLINGKLDTATSGTKTLKVTYMGVSIVVNYVVLDATAGDLSKSWADEGVEGVGKDLYNLLKNGGNIKLEKNYDLAGYQWEPVANFNGTFDGNGYKISNMTITNSKAFGDAGLFGKIDAKVTIKNVILENVKIDMGDNIVVENAKNYGCLIGNMSGSNSEISNITVNNATIKGNGRLGGILGVAYKSCSISSCNVENALLIGTNPIAIATDDGEADKIGGIVGQAQKAITINNCKVKVVINGTRDLGGIIGFIMGESTIINNEVLAQSIITASVEGGMLASKGTRNVGGIIGTILNDNLTITITKNTINANVVIATNTIYPDSSCGDFIGGYRNVNTITLQDNASTPIKDTFKISDGIDKINEFLVEKLNNSRIIEE